MGCPPAWQQPSGWQGPLQQHQPWWWQEVCSVLPWVTFAVSDTSVAGHSLALLSESRETHSLPRWSSLPLGCHL